MKATIVLALMAVMVAVVYAKENGATTAIMAGAGSGMSMSLNPLTTFQGGCQACVGAYPVCIWCANSGPGCFTPAALGASCCGCVNGPCFLCAHPSSCATWSPYNPSFCPPATPWSNSTAFGYCNWNQKVTLRYQEKSVMRCHSIPTNYNSVVNWNISPNSDGQFEVWILDQRNFDLYISNQPFACLNQNCRAGGTSVKYGQFTNFGSPGYYVIVTKTNQNFSGTSSYYINAFVR